MIDFAVFANPLRVERAAGILLVARSTRRMLLLRRSDDGTWSVPGGRLEPGELAHQAAFRELREETGISATAPRRPGVLRHQHRPIEYTTFYGEVDREFEVELNWEHTTAGWFSPGELPKPLHPGLREALAAGRR